MKKIKVILKKSPITKIGKSRILPDNDAVRGMINKVSYMLEVKEINDEVK